MGAILLIGARKRYGPEIGATNLWEGIESADLEATPKVSSKSKQKS